MASEVGHYAMLSTSIPVGALDLDEDKKRHAAVLPLDQKVDATVVPADCRDPHLGSGASLDDAFGILGGDEFSERLANTQWVRLEVRDFHDPRIVVPKPLHPRCKTLALPQLAQRHRIRLPTHPNRTRYNEGAVRSPWWMSRPTRCGGPCAAG